MVEHNKEEKLVEVLHSHAPIQLIELESDGRPKAAFSDL